MLASVKSAAGVALAALAVAGCGGSGAGTDSRTAAEQPGSAPRGSTGYEFPPAPEAPTGELDSATSETLAQLLDSAAAGRFDADALDGVADSGDPRLAWLVSDLLRFTPPGDGEQRLASAFGALTGVDPSRDPSFAQSAWLSVTDHLIAWETPAPPGYRELKAKLFVEVEPGWEPFFADAGSAIDWRFVSWGGVPIDDRPLGDPEPCPGGCIPALDDPALTDADGGDWYPDDRTVFGVVVGGEAVAFPKNVMEVHEMVNITIGGRRLGIPYCTLCGSAQAYLLDSVPRGLDQPVLRTSGLLSRSNKLMYDLRSRSAIDTFTGRALSGPLHDAGVTLDQTSVVASSWGEWKRAHPDTEIVARDGGIGRSYPADPLGGRDDEGPIFPVGDVDPRLPVQAPVIGVIAPSGDALAFPAEQARAALRNGDAVVLSGVELVADGDGLRARAGGKEQPSHQAFWFAWSQFHPGTAVWAPLG